jgi:hypothetical protein
VFSNEVEYQTLYQLLRRNFLPGIRKRNFSALPFMLLFKRIKDLKSKNSETSETSGENQQERQQPKHRKQEEQQRKHERKQEKREKRRQRRKEKQDREDALRQNDPNGLLKIALQRGPRRRSFTATDPGKYFSSEGHWTEKKSDDESENVEGSGESK